MTYLVNDYKFCRFGRSTETQIIVPGSLLTERLFPSLCAISGFLSSTTPSFTNKLSE